MATDIPIGIPTGILVRHPDGKTTLINKCLDISTLLDEVSLKCDIEKYNIKLVNSNNITIALPEHITEIIYLVILSPFVYSFDKDSKIVDYSKGILDLSSGIDTITVYQWGNYIYERYFGLCNKYQKINILAKDTPCLISVTSMSYCFYGLKVMGDLSQWDVSSVNNMKYMFSHSSFNGGGASGGISNWNVSNVTNMQGMFKHSNFNGGEPIKGISDWDVSNVTDMSWMFAYSRYDKDISRWNVSKVIDMSYMFCGSRFNKDISQWNVSKVVNMICMFKESNLRLDLSKWIISDNCNISDMFKESYIYPRYSHKHKDWGYFP